MTQEQASVARGAALLDARRPGWESAIDLGRLDLSSSCACVLGQLEGCYSTGIFALFGAQWIGEAEAHGFGFAAPEKHSIRERAEAFGRLQDTWVAEIGARLSRASLVELGVTTLA